MNHAFTLYALDIAQLLDLLSDANSASFDVDDDGNVQVHVEGKPTLNLYWWDEDR